MTAFVVGFDPAVRSPGVAVAVDREIVGVERVVVPPAVHSLAEEGARWDAVALLCADVARRWLVGWCANSVLVVYERPQWYAHSKVDPNDLACLAAIGAAFATEIRRTYPPNFVTIRTPTAREWTMGTSKAKKGSIWACPRGYQLQKRLSPAELARVPDQHDAMDAACLALFGAGRWEPTRVNHRPA